MGLVATINLHLSRRLNRIQQAYFETALATVVIYSAFCTAFPPTKSMHVRVALLAAFPSLYSSLHLSWCPFLSRAESFPHNHPTHLPHNTCKQPLTVINCPALTAHPISIHSTLVGCRMHRRQLSRDLPSETSISRLFPQLCNDPSMHQSVLWPFRQSVVYSTVRKAIETTVVATAHC